MFKRPMTILAALSLLGAATLGTGEASASGTWWKPRHRAVPELSVTQTGSVAALLLGAAAMMLSRRRRPQGE